MSQYEGTSRTNDAYADREAAGGTSDLLWLYSEFQPSRGNHAQEIKAPPKAVLVVHPNGRCIVATPIDKRLGIGSLQIH